MSQYNSLISKIKPFQKADNLKSLWIISYSVLLTSTFILSSASSYSIHPALSILFWPPVFVIFCRLFVIEHDCGHFSFFTKPYQNRIAGSIAGFILLIPFSLWRYIHNLHHSTMGNLDKRNINPELWTMTTEEYTNASFSKKIAYRILRSVYFHILLMPFILIIISKFPQPKLGIRATLSLVSTDLVYVLIFYILLINNLLQLTLFVYFIPLYAFYIFASLIFHLQHQYEDTYWKPDEEWNFADAALAGSSFLDFKPFLRWITGNVGYHHIHHLNSKIPFYNLPYASNEVSAEIKVKPIKFRYFYRYFNCKLWDSDMQKLVPYNFSAK